LIAVKLEEAAEIPAEIAILRGINVSPASRREGCGAL